MGGLIVDEAGTGTPPYLDVPSGPEPVDRDRPGVERGLVAGAEGTSPSFDDFVRERLPGLVRYAVMLSRDRELGEDIVQDVLVRAHGRWATIGPLARPDLYVKRMVTNEYLSWRRRRRLRTSTLLPDSIDESRPGGPPPADQAAADRSAMWAELAQLPRQQQVVLVLRFYEGLDDAEIAAVLGCRPGTVRGYASRALARLRIDLAAWRVDEESGLTGLGEVTRDDRA